MGPSEVNYSNPYHQGEGPMSYPIRSTSWSPIPSVRRESTDSRINEEFDHGLIVNQDHGWRLREPPVYRVPEPTTLEFLPNQFETDRNYLERANVEYPASERGHEIHYFQQTEYSTVDPRTEVNLNISY